MTRSDPLLAKEVLNHPLIAERYFPGYEAPVPDATEITSGRGTLLAHHQWVEGAKMTLVHFHGNGEGVADYVPDLCDEISGLGVNVLMTEYRGYGGSDGAPLLGDMLEDVRAFHDYLKVPDESIIVYGRSSGSIFALEWIHQFPQTAGLILESAVADVGERLRFRLSPAELGVSEAAFDQVCHELLDHRKKLSGYEQPVLIMHALRDSLVDSQNAVQLRGWSPSPLSRITLLPDGNHNNVIQMNPMRWWLELKNYLRLVENR
jgi:alpha-beta hydrolase superfamily lysophospholipase